jgi:hypothetical protein
VKNPIRYVVGKNVFEQDGKVCDYDLSADDKPIGQIGTSGSMVEWERTVFVPTKGQSEFSQGWEYVLPSTHVEPIVLVAAGVTTEVEVDYPDELTVDVVFGHRRGKEAVVTPQRHPRSWKLNAGSLPYQVVNLEWRMKTKDKQKAGAGA